MNDFPHRLYNKPNFPMSSTVPQSTGPDSTVVNNKKMGAPFALPYSLSRSF
jgi:hypothetical protein